MSEVKQNALIIAGLLALALLVNNLPWSRQSSGLTEALYQMGENQEEIADNAATYAVSGAEGTLVAEHEVDGSNWSIPSILRHWLGEG